MPARQQASVHDMHRDATGATEEMKRYFKVQLHPCGKSSRIWIAIKAKSIGEAFVIADNRTLDTSFIICDGSIIEITQREYYGLISRTV
ncbi:hypothetical protein SAMN04487941_1944 [Pontibacter akesuensis]|uniref:Uncharacterized protein n=2 Tax=Pontibacter akesuensis TaxID=388950 RepID=A0A1I7I614_9BACT|nr:hypothetical protein SAMN04487941_1944 [Pontibacter akesuensis]